VTEKLRIVGPHARGTVVRTTARAEAGITEWTLSNGATVVLRPTTLKEDQILFRVAAPRGTSLASDADFISARIADDVVPAGGVARFNGVTLDKILAGKAVAVTPFINEIDQGMAGGSTPQDLQNDVPAHIPAIHAAARRSDRVRRDRVAGQSAAREPDGQP
jgi:zinc protease